MEENKYLELQYEMKDTIENLKELKEILQAQCIQTNLYGKGKTDAAEIAFDFDRAIEALEKQIPKKPKIKMISCDVQWWCPNCGEDHIMMDSKKGFKYCHHCGQKLDWSEEDEQ